jgi:hypothetical protein
VGERDRYQRDRQRPDHRHRQRRLAIEDGGHDEEQHHSEAQSEPCQRQRAAQTREQQNHGEKDQREHEDRGPTLEVDERVLATGQRGRAGRRVGCLGHLDVITGIDVRVDQSGRSQPQLGLAALIGPAGQAHRYELTAAVTEAGTIRLLHLEHPRRSRRWC